MAVERTMIEMRAVQTRLNDAEIEALVRVLRDGTTLATGPEAEAFEREFSAFAGSAGAVAVNSCSSALELAAILSDLQAGDEVIIPGHTFVSSAVPFARHGVRVRWADIDPETRLITAETIASVLTPKTKLIVVVHLYGLAAEMTPILALAKAHGVRVVEDCAQAPGARYEGRRVGSLGDFGCFSFHTQKNITTLGEGGMLLVRDAADVERAKRLRWMGNWHFGEPRACYWKPAMGNLVEPVPGRWPHNFCLGEPNAAVGRLLLQRLDAINGQRQEQAARFKAALRNVPELSFQTTPPGCEHVYHLMSARFDGQAMAKHRDDLIACLYERYQVKPVVQYWPLYRSELFRNAGFGEANCPEADRFFDNMLSFPWWSDMPDDLIDDLAARIRDAVNDLKNGSAR